MGNEYHKIDSIFKRDPATNFKTFLDGQWSRPEFGYLAELDWEWTEKVDGTNIRVELLTEYHRIDTPTNTVSFKGRTNAASIPAPLMQRLMELFPVEKLVEVFPNDEETDRRITLYGEGYGKGIQKGGGDYIPDGVDFVLFDIRVGNVFLRRGAVDTLAVALGVLSAPIVGRGTITAAIEKTYSGMPSLMPGAKCMSEGLVLRPVVELNDRMGNRIITKIKTRDFQGGGE